jgi:hypothetical protein
MVFKNLSFLAAFLLLILSVTSSQAAPAKFEQPNAYAVVIGISQYREEVISKIPYAAKDAEAIAQVLEVQAGIPKTHIKLLTDSKATNTDIRSHLNDWLSMRVKPDSTVYVYYAGHGTPNPQTGDVYLVPWDGNPDFPSSLYSLKEFYAGLNKLPTKEILVMLDSCFSGAPGRSVLAKGSRPMVISLENPLLAGGKIAVLSASTGNQISSDYDKGGHGLFTHYLLAGLAGAADKDKNHLVTLKELYPYVRNHVSETALDELNREQTPMLLPGEDVLGARARQNLVQVVPGFTPSITTQTEQPKPIQEARAGPYEAIPQPREITGKDGAPMVLIPGGDFRFYTVQRSIPAFYMDKYEVTTLLYAAFVKATGRAYPVDGRRFPWGDDQPSTENANFGKGFANWKGYSTLTTVGSYEDGKSPFGLYDMSGNVWEWSSSGEGELKDIHGGGWADSSGFMASTTTNSRYPSHTAYDLGFRCAQAVRN